VYLNISLGFDFSKILLLLLYGIFKIRLDERRYLDRYSLKVTLWFHVEHGAYFGGLRVWAEGFIEPIFWVKRVCAPTLLHGF